MFVTPNIAVYPVPQHQYIQLSLLNNYHYSYLNTTTISMDINLKALKLSIATRLTER